MELESSNQPALTIDLESTEHDLFLKCGSVRLAKRGYSGTPHAGTWISLEAGWSFLDSADRKEITITLRGAGGHALRFVKPVPCFPTASSAADRPAEASVLGSSPDVDTRAQLESDGW